MVRNPYVAHSHWTALLLSLSLSSLGFRRNRRLSSLSNTLDVLSLYLLSRRCRLLRLSRWVRRVSESVISLVRSGFSVPPSSLSLRPCVFSVNRWSETVPLPPEASLPAALRDRVLPFYVSSRRRLSSVRVCLFFKKNIFCHLGFSEIVVIS